MRILILINGMGGGGAERVVSTLTEYFVRQRGHEVELMTIHGGDAYPLPVGTRPRRLLTGRLCVGPFKLLALPLVAMEFAWRVRRAKPDLVLSLLVRSNLVNVMSAMLARRRPVILSERVATDHHYRGSRPSDRFMLRLIATLYTRADRIIAISEGVRESLSRIGVPGDLVQVIHNPQSVDTIHRQASSPRRPPGSGDRFAIVTVGRLEPQKDHQTLLRALALAAERVPVHLTILGAGPLEQELRAVAAHLGISHAVEFGGWTENPFEVVAGSDLFVLSSRWEGFGNVLVEALACGVPVVSTDCESGPREILEDGRYGLLVAPGDPSALSDAIVRVATDPDLAARLREGSVARAKQFDVALQGALYLTEFERALSHSSISDGSR